MRLAQLAKQIPWQKKNTETAIRICSLEYWLGNGEIVINDLRKTQIYLKTVHHKYYLSASKQLLLQDAAGRISFFE